MCWEYSVYLYWYICSNNVTWLIHCYYSTAAKCRGRTEAALTTSAPLITNMIKPFHSFSVTPAIDVDVFLSKVRQYRQHCEVISVRDKIALCRRLEAFVDSEIDSLKQQGSLLFLHGHSLNMVPTDPEVIIKMTRDVWRMELLGKLKSTLMKITALVWYDMVHTGCIVVKRLKYY